MYKKKSNVLNCFYFKIDNKNAKKRDINHPFLNAVVQNNSRLKIKRIKKTLFAAAILKKIEFIPLVCLSSESKQSLGLFYLVELYSET